MKKNLKRIIASMSAAAAMGSYVCAPMTAPVMLCEAPAFTAVAAEAITSGDYSYTVLDSGNISISKYTGTDTELTVPSEIDGLTVEAIGQNAYQNNTAITSVIIPATIKTIGGYAFRYCKNLKSVTLQEGLETIGSDAFVSTALTEIYFPATVKDAYHPFEGCNISKITFGKNITTIPENAFQSVTGLTEIEIPATVSTIKAYSFRYCKNLKSVSLPEGLETIGSDAFVSTALTEIYFPATVKDAYHPFEDCNISKITFGKNITTIPENAFQSVTGLEEIEIPATVSTIKSYAFRYCKNLKSVSLPEGLETIGSDAFVGTALTDIYFPATVENAYHPFEGCNISKVTFGKNITTIPEDAFQSVTGLTEIEIPATVSTIKNYAFRYCKNLKSVSLPEGLETIGSDAFVGTALTDIYFPATIKNAYHPFEGCNISKVTFGKNITAIPEYAFQSVTGLTEIEIPATVSTIKSYAFRYCKNLKNVTLNEGLESISSDAFTGCGLTSVSVPSTVKNIYSGVFASNQNLISAEIKCPIKSIPTDMFNGCSKLRTVTLPDTIEKINNSAFNGCTLLKQINSNIESVNFDGPSCMYGCYSLKDQRFRKVDNAVTDLKADKTKCEAGDTINFTLTYAFPESLADRSEAKQITINFPSGVTLVSDSFQMEGNDISITNAAKGTIPVTGTSGTLKFSAKINQAGEKIISADLSHTTPRGEKSTDNWTSPVGIVFINSEIEDTPVTTTTKPAVTTTTTKPAATTTKPATTTTKAPTAPATKPAITTTKAPATSTKPVTTTEEPTLTVIPYTSSTKTPVSTTKPVTSTVPATTVAPVTNPPEFGDPNNDGNIDASDATFVLVEYSNLSTGNAPSFNSATFLAADVNKDGSIDASDASLMLMYYAYVSTGNSGTFEVFLKLEVK